MPERDWSVIRRYPGVGKAADRPHGAYGAGHGQRGGLGCGVRFGSLGQRWRRRFIPFLVELINQGLCYGDQSVHLLCRPPGDLFRPGLVWLPQIN